MTYEANKAGVIRSEKKKHEKRSRMAWADGKLERKV